MRVDNIHSLERGIMAGVSLRIILGTLLFSVLVNDVPRLPGTRLDMFADDAAVYAVDHWDETSVITSGTLDD